jgi:hypothetical protein
VIRDLGYFSIGVFQAIQEAKAYFLSRLKSGVNFYLNMEDEKPLDIGEYLKDNVRKNQNVIEINGYLGKEKFAVRLIIYRQSEDVTNQRKRAANKHARKKGETLSKSKNLSLEFAIFITNAPLELLSIEMVGTVYRLRWDIELIFKRWKSQLNIDYLKGICVERIDCLIWSRLCTVAIVELVIGYVKSICRQLGDVECSEVKVIEYLMRTSSFFFALARNQLESFIEEMEKDIPRMLLKDKRKRTTMREKVLIGESYYGMQITEGQFVA